MKRATVWDAISEEWVGMVSEQDYKQAILEEREACAQLAETYNCYCGCGKVVAQAIRARSSEEKGK
jgi:hypothetical protein